MKLRVMIAVLACKLCRSLIRLLGRGGTDFPGRVALKLCPNLLGELAKNVKLLATRGTAAVLRQRGLDVEEVLKVYEGRPNIVDLLINHEVALVINTASGKHTAKDSKAIRHAALMFKVPYCTTIAAARATATAIGSRRDEVHVESLQEYYAREARG